MQGKAVFTKEEIRCLFLSLQRCFYGEKMRELVSKPKAAVALSSAGRKKKPWEDEEMAIFKRPQEEDKQVDR